MRNGIPDSRPKYYTISSATLHGVLVELNYMHSCIFAFKLKFIKLTEKADAPLEMSYNFSLKNRNIAHLLCICM